MRKVAFFILVTLSFMGCKEPYTSPDVSRSSGFLVVEGAINSGSGQTDISISRSIGLNSRDEKFENGATVQIQSEDSRVILLQEGEDGHYYTENLNLNNSKKYRLSIQTSDGEVYQSDFLNVKNNPEIDGVNWDRTEEGLELNVSTHDDAGDTRYYRWDFIETWEKNAAFRRRLEFEVKRVGNLDTYKVVYRPIDDGSGRYFDSTMYYCWKEYTSSELLLGTSAQLSKDQINQMLTHIPTSSQKLEGLYSIMVKQYSLSREAYEFLEVMKKNSELTGSIFDAQPAVLYGNIHNVNRPDELVVGFMTICPIREKRIFIHKREVPDWEYFPGCKTTTFTNSNDIVRDEVIIGYLPISDISPPPLPFPSLPSFLAAPTGCVNCRATGSNQRPDFWPETY